MTAEEFLKKYGKEINTKAQVKTTSQGTIDTSGAQKFLEEYRKQQQKNVVPATTPTFNTREEALEYAKNNNFNVAGTSPKIPQLVTDKMKGEARADSLIGKEARQRMEFMIDNNEKVFLDNRNDIEAFKALTGKSEEETKQYIIDNLGKQNKYDYRTFRANYEMGDLQTDLNKAYYDYIETPSKANEEKIKEIENSIKNYAQYAKNYNKGGLITKDFATFVPQEIEQTGRGIGSALAVGGTGAVAGGAVGSAVPRCWNSCGCYCRC